MQRYSERGIMEHGQGRHYREKVSFGVGWPYQNPKYLATEPLALAPIFQSRGMKLSHRISLHIRFAIVDAIGLEPGPSDARMGVHASRSISTVPERYLELWRVHPRSEGLTQPKKPGPGI